MISFQQHNILNGWPFPDAPKMSGNPRDLIDVFGPSMEGEVVQSFVDRVLFDGSSDNIQLIR